MSTAVRARRVRVRFPSSAAARRPGALQPPGLPTPSAQPGLPWLFPLFYRSLEDNRLEQYGARGVRQQIVDSLQEFAAYMVQARGILDVAGRQLHEIDLQHVDQARLDGLDVLLIVRRGQV